MLHKRGRLTLLATLAMALSLVGCSTLFSETRNKQSEDLKVAYAKVELTAPVAASRKNLAALLDEQLKLEDELWRQFGLTQAHLAATSWTVGDFKSNSNARIAGIVGNGTDYGKLLAASADERLTLPAEGEYGAARKELKRLEDDQAAARKQVDDAVKAVRTASAEYDALLKSVSTEPGHAQKVDDAKKKLATAFDQLSKLQSAAGQEFISSAKVEGLDEFLSTYDNIRAGKGAPEGSNRLAIALALFPDIQDQVEKARLDAEKPRLLPIVMAKQVEQAKLAAAQRNVARIETTIGLQRQRVAVLIDQLDTLDSALRGLGPLTDSQPLRPLLQPLKPGHVPTEAEMAPRIQAWRPLALYLKAQVNLRAQQNKLQHQVIALGYEEPLSLAESGLQQWKALLDPSVELLALYGASGLKAKDIQDFINTLALLWIAAKVN